MTHAELIEAGYEISDAAYSRLAAFIHALVAENQNLNLTSLRNEADIWSVHACDSLALLAALRKRGARRLLDLGTGGGLPGVPLACACPDVHVTLLDATGKKVRAIERIVAQVGLSNVTCVCGRAETLAHETELRESFDAVTARAVAALPTLIELAAGFASLGALCWFFKTPSALAEEVPAAETAARRCGVQQRCIWKYVLPSGHGERALIAYEKTSPTPADLPRPSGRAAKRPL